MRVTARQRALSRRSLPVSRLPSGDNRLKRPPSPSPPFLYPLQTPPTDVEATPMWAGLDGGGSEWTRRGKGRITEEAWRWVRRAAFFCFPWAGLFVRPFLPRSPETDAECKARQRAGAGEGWDLFAPGPTGRLAPETGRVQSGWGSEIVLGHFKGKLGNRLLDLPSVSPLPPRKNTHVPQTAVLFYFFFGIVSFCNPRSLHVSIKPV